MDCECDAGFSGPDCSLRQFKFGVDPLSAKYPIYDFAIVTNKAGAVASDTELFTDGQTQSQIGHWAIRYFDNAGEDWLTAPVEAGASCAAVIDAQQRYPFGRLLFGLRLRAHSSPVQAGLQARSLGGLHLNDQ